MRTCCTGACRALLARRTCHTDCARARLVFVSGMRLQHLTLWAICGCLFRSSGRNGTVPLHVMDR